MTELIGRGEGKSETKELCFRFNRVFIKSLRICDERAEEGG